MARARAMISLIVWRIPGPAALERMADADVVALISTRPVTRRKVDAACAELTRRAEAECRERARRDRLARARARRVIERIGYDTWVHGQWLAAEEACRGHLVRNAGRDRTDKLGRPAGIDPLSLFSGPGPRACKWASEELLAWWAEHPRMSFAEWKAGQREPAPDPADPRRLAEVA